MKQAYRRFGAYELHARSDRRWQHALMLDYTGINNQILALLAAEAGPGGKASLEKTE